LLAGRAGIGNVGSFGRGLAHASILANPAEVAKEC
jgi:hypothetical protein